MEAIFRVEENRVLVSPNAAGPWDPRMQHGAAPSSLAVWAAERIATPSEMRIARVTIDLMRPVPLAPLTGAVKVTATPGTGFPNVSVTVAWSALVKAVLTVTLWPEPAVAAIWAGLLGVTVTTTVFPAL